VSQMDRRQALKLLAALGSTGLLAACGAEAGGEGADQLSDEPVRIGLMVPQNGALKAIGDEMVNGFQLFLKLNDQRLGGHPVELVIADEGETTDSARDALDKLLKQGVLALSGVASSTAMLAIRDDVEKARVPLIGSNASPAVLQSVIYTWRTSYVSDEPGRALGTYVAQRVPKSGTVVIIAPEHADGQDAVTGFRESFGASDSRLSETIWTGVSMTPNKNYYAGQISQLLARDPDAVYCCFSGAAAVEFLRQLHRAGYRKQIYAPGFLTEGSALSDLKPTESEGIMTVLNYSADLNNAANRRFASAYRRAHNASPTTYAVASYDAAQVLNKAIRLAAGRLSPQQLILELPRVGQIDSPRGFWQFNQTRTPLQKWYLRRVQRDGQVLSNVLINELATLG
jgi:branched-chain amino acid transport system substrate-binding protein